MSYEQTARRRFVVGDRVGRLKVVEYLELDHARKRLLRCVCDCGKVVVVRLNNLGRKTNSCGCLKAALIKERMGKPIEDLAVMAVLGLCRRRTPDTDLKFSIVKGLIFSNCTYCNGAVADVGTLFRRPLDDGRSVLRIGIDRVDSARGYYRDNVVACCKVCNYIKRDHSLVALQARLTIMVGNIHRLQQGNAARIVMK